MNHAPVMTPRTAFAASAAELPVDERDCLVMQKGSFRRSKETASITPAATAFAIPSDRWDNSVVKKNGIPPRPEASAIGNAYIATVTHVALPLGRGIGCGRNRQRAGQPSQTF